MAKKLYESISSGLYRTKSEIRFWKKVKILGEDDCWEYQGTLGRNGYGEFSYKKSTKRAHRTAWFFTYGEIPEGLCVCHTCDNRACCNPLHLFLGTQEDNIRDMIEKGRNSGALGENNGRAKLTESDVRAMRRLRKCTGLTYRKLADLFGVSFSLVHQVCKNQIWRDLEDESG